MKLRYIALLILGTTVAGGLAVKMTQPAPVEIATVTPEAPAPATPAAVEQTKPSPMPATSVPIPTATAPPAVYTEHAASTPVPAPTPESKKRTQSSPAPARTQPPIRIASAPPLQWTAVPYQRPSANLAPAQAPVPQPEQAAAEPVPAPAPRHVTLATGMTIVVRLSEPLSADRAAAGDRFRAALLDPLVVDGLVIAESGSRVLGRVVESQKQSWLNRRSLLELELTSVSTSDGQDVTISTDPWSEQGEQPANAPVGTVIRFRLAGKVNVTERQL